MVNPNGHILICIKSLGLKNKVTLKVWIAPESTKSLKGHQQFNNLLFSACTREKSGKKGEKGPIKKPRCLMGKSWRLFALLKQGGKRKSYGKLAKLWQAKYET